MDLVVSQIVIIALGVTILMLSAWGVIVPDRLMMFVTSTLDRRWGIHVAVVVRLVLGAALIRVAPASLFPSTFQVLGVLALLAALTLTIAGRKRVRRFLGWWVEQFSASANRTWLLLGAAFGAFLVYGVL